MVFVCVYIHIHVYIHTCWHAHMHTYITPTAKGAETKPSRHSSLHIKGRMNMEKKTMTNDMKCH